MKHTFKGTLLATVMILPAVASLASCGNKVRAPGFTFWHTFAKGTEAKLKDIAHEFEDYIYESTGKRIEVVLEKFGGYDGIKEKIEKNLTVGNIPNLAVAYPDHVANYMEKGKLEGDPGKYVWKLNDFFNDPEIGFGKQTEFIGDDPNHAMDFFQPFMEEGQQYIQEGTYSLPFMKSTEVLFYNETLLRQYLNNYEPYKQAATSITRYMDNLTWADLMNLCEFVRADLDKPEAQRTVKGTKLTHVFGYDSDANMFITRLIQQNIPYSSYDTSAKQGRVDFASNVNAEAFGQVRDDLLYLRDLYQRKILLTKLTNGGKYSSDKFKLEETLFTVGSSGGSDYNEPAGDAFVTRVTKVPAINDNCQYITQGVTLTFLKNPTETDEMNMERMRYAWQFAKYITNPECNLDFCINSNGYFPVRESALTTDTWIETMADEDALKTKAYKAVTEQVRHRYFNTALFKGSAELRTQMGSLVGQALLAQPTSSKTIEEVIEGLITTQIGTAMKHF